MTAGSMLGLTSSRPPARARRPTWPASARCRRRPARLPAASSTSVSIERNGSGEFSGTSIASMPASKTARADRRRLVGLQAAQDRDEPRLQLREGRAHACGSSGRAGRRCVRAASNRPARTASSASTGVRRIAGALERLRHRARRAGRRRRGSTLPPARRTTRRAEAISPPISRPDSAAAASCRLHAGEQRRGADAEKPRRRVAGIGQRRRRASAPKTGIVGRDRARRSRRAMAQDRLLRQHGEQLAGHPGGKPVTAPSCSSTHLRMRARHADRDRRRRAQAGRCRRAAFPRRA